ncbi:dihydrofolate reductase [Thioalkalivibrio denitrificans]|uniref:Dihydrofolate reductase n=1 Tax=Thioalkalivibrio denitrificans TaxID=108003 RepID=A0A1V3NII2_9GAMM|nr:type 3 dihydrofolate reductase [Thioalkalivibrio denitrificans]OOG24784.1 dihydrofolate reductase [Thioalkalivibrio denitrificans]
MKLSLIVAVDRNNLIGRNNQLPWHLPADLAFFKRTTMGAPMLMGRKTWESIGRPLPGRTSIVITRDPDYRAEGAIVVHSIDEALRAAGEASELFVIGGAKLYKDALQRADRIYLTRIDHAFEGDTWFPEIGPEWKEVHREEHAPDEKNPYPYAFITLDRNRRKP